MSVSLIVNIWNFIVSVHEPYRFSFNDEFFQSVNEQLHI